jgi:carboxypeptidase C (cathepsin A)
MLASSLALIAGLATITQAQTGYPLEDKVTELMNQTNVGKTFDMYSGYLNITHTKKALHYVAVTS